VSAVWGRAGSKRTGLCVLTLATNEDRPLRAARWFTIRGCGARKHLYCTLMVWDRPHRRAYHDQQAFLRGWLVDTFGQARRYAHSGVIQCAGSEIAEERVAFFRNGFRLRLNLSTQLVFEPLPQGLIGGQPGFRVGSEV
jgi:hypothetical protein